MKRTIFLDDGGVMNENELRGPQWQRLVGEFMAPRLGGRSLDWAVANKATGDRVFHYWLQRLGQEPLSSFRDDYLFFDWLRSMCEMVGVGVPNRVEAVSIAREASAYVTRRVHTAFPGAVPAIRHLHADGHLLHTASSEHSDDLAGYLDGMGIRQLFGRLYGPDLLDLPLHGPQYYQRLFEDSGTAPGEALVVDDSPDRAKWALDAGASAVLVARDGPAPDIGCTVISSLKELPTLTEAIVNR